ncbi:serine hydrolase [Salegentibacter salinarum]|uniref:Serine hydrolase n=1 Tax=Salegentibacter salinarum TaxID=447422 RepID=A0A2N0TN37_9FLAO|nr:serine hydrolase domain-containing protein [Salegentibacter salinarum]PKD16108.1 serine hydrolase [Salegentibacter salinarum]SKB69257.1 CubicO group peptidase, beta-lactamase class C family [Salegentibacter salinarum]
MRSIFLNIARLSIFIGSLAISAQTSSINNSGTLETAAPAEVGMSSERILKIEEMLKSAIDENQIPGAVALIARDGKIVFHEAYGEADASGKELEKDAIFRLASQTKAITATAVMMLWEEGKFRLDDPVSKYIPEFKDPNILKDFKESDSTFTTTPAENEITIRHLLTHTSGLGYGMIDSDDRIKKIYAKAGITELFTEDEVSIGENVKKLATLPLHHEPGEKFTYSLGLDVLGYFIEVISGQDFDEFLKKRIFDPLQMDDTRFYQPSEKKDRLVAVQHKKEGEWENYPNTFYNTNYPLAENGSFFSGGAGLSGTAEDYAKFLQMYLNGGEYNGTRLLSRKTVDIIMGNQSGEKFNYPNQYYGLSFGIVSETGEIAGGQGSAGTFDWGGYFNTQYFADPEEQIIGILLKQTQGNTGDETGWKFRQMLFSAVDD